MGNELLRAPMTHGYIHCTEQPVHPGMTTPLTYTPLRLPLFRSVRVQGVQWREEREEGRERHTQRDRVRDGRQRKPEDPNLRHTYGSPTGLESGVDSILQSMLELDIIDYLHGKCGRIPNLWIWNFQSS